MEQAPTTQGVAAVVMASFLGPHWQAKSVAPQLDAEMAEARQDIAQAGN